MGPKADCPFLASPTLSQCGTPLLRGMRRRGIDVECHAEATSEKQALGWHLDGRVVAVIGTHTHVRDRRRRRCCRSGTAFGCDARHDRFTRERAWAARSAPVIASFLDGMPRRLEVAEEGRASLGGPRRLRSRVPTVVSTRCIGDDIAERCLSVNKKAASPSERGLRN
jgi:calcineurin-like phosphoesterase